jgi:hypothetical protein
VLSLPARLKVNVSQANKGLDGSIKSLQATATAPVSRAGAGDLVMRIASGRQSPVAVPERTFGQNNVVAQSAPRVYCRGMKGLRYVYWQDGQFWLGYLEEYPDYLTQGESLQDLQEHLRDLYADLSGGHIPAVRKVAELEVA